MLEMHEFQKTIKLVGLSYYLETLTRIQISIIHSKPQKSKHLIKLGKDHQKQFVLTEKKCEFKLLTIAQHAFLNEPSHTDIKYNGLNKIGFIHIFTPADFHDSVVLPFIGFHINGC